MLPVTGAINMARNRVAQGFRRIISGDPEGTPEWVRQLADGVDPGYFGPGSAAWTVHGSLPTLVGGVRALLMQALHPGALAGVVQHSRYEEDPLGRLAGTTQWLTVVTFGDTGDGRPRMCSSARDASKRFEVCIRWAERCASTRLVTPNSCVGSTLRSPIPSWQPIACGVARYPGAKTPTCESGRKPESSSVLTIRRGLLPNSRSRSAASALIYEAIKRRGTRSTSSGRRRCRYPPKAPTAFCSQAVATIPESHRRLLKLPRVPITAVKPAVSALLGGMSLVLGPTSPSMRNAADRIERLDEVQPA